MRPKSIRFWNHHTIDLIDKEKELNFLRYHPREFVRIQINELMHFDFLYESKSNNWNQSSRIETNFFTRLFGCPIVWIIDGYKYSLINKWAFSTFSTKYSIIETNFSKQSIWTCVTSIEKAKIKTNDKMKNESNRTNIIGQFLRTR